MYSITEAGCSPLAIEWLEVFFVVTSVVEEASGTLLRLQVVQVALLQVALRSSSSVFREHLFLSGNLLQTDGHPDLPEDSVHLAAGHDRLLQRKIFQHLVFNLLW